MQCGSRLLYLLLAWLAAATRPSSAAFELTVLHTNDLHSRAASKCYGGVARLKHLADEIRREEEHVVMLNAGDFFQGTVWYSMFKWRIVANLTSSLGYTATSLGNHELDDGVEDLVQFVNATRSAYPSLACNLDLSGEPELAGLLQKSLVVQVGGRWVGIIGYVTPDTKELASTGEIVFQEEVASLREEVARLREQFGVNVVIALGHSGYEKDLEIAEKVEGLDLVVGGHTNTFLYNGVSPLKETPRAEYPKMVLQPATGKSVPVVQTSGYGKYLGRVKLRFDEDGELLEASGNPLLLKSSIPEDPALKRVVNLYRNRVNERMEVKVGVAKVFIDGGRPKCRLEECEFGNLVTDAMAHEMGVEIALINSGAIKDSFHQGPITMRDVVQAMPWSNTVDVARIPGKALLAALEHSVAKYDAASHDPSGKFLQLSGLHVVYDVRRPPGQRVRAARTVFNDEEIRADQEYDVAVLSFMVKGGDGYKMITNNLLEHRNTGFLDNDLLVAYIRKKTPLSAPQGGRIVFVSEGSTAGAAESARRALPLLGGIVVGFLLMIL